MQLGIGTYTYGWAFETSQSFEGSQGFEGSQALNELSLVDLAVSLGVSVIQVADNLPLHTFSEDRLRTFRQALQEKNIKIEVGARGLNNIRLQQYIDICRYLGAGILRFVTDEENYTPGAGEITEIIREHLGLLEKHNVTLALENHDRLSAGRLAGIIQAVASPYVGICLDTVNSMGAGEGVSTVIDTLGPYTVNLHIKDFGIRRLAHKQGFVIDGRIAGEGMLDIPFLLHRINSYQRCGTCILEQWVPPEDKSTDTITKERWWAQKSIAYLRRIGT